MDMQEREFEFRVAALEKRVKLLWIAVTGTVTVLCILLAYPLLFTDATVIAPAYVLTDSSGLVRGEWTVRDGNPVITLLDTNGRERVTLVHDQQQTALFLRDEHGDTRVGVAQFSHGGGGFALHGDNMKGAAVLYYKNGGSLSFFDTLGTITARVPSAEHHN